MSQNLRLELHPLKDYITNRNRIKVYQILEEHLFSRTEHLFRRKDK